MLCTSNKGKNVIKFISKAIVVTLLAINSSYAGTWGDIGTVGTLNNNELCYTDGTDIICDAGLWVNGTAALDVSGTVSATAFVGDGSALTGVVATSITLGINDLTDAKHDTDDFSSLFIGNGAGANDDGTNNKNMGIGKNALKTVTTGNYNMALGAESLSNITEGWNNIAIGYSALINTTVGSDNIALGSSALNASSGNANVAIGDEAQAFNGSGDGNVSLGYQSQKGPVAVNTGSYNVSLGYETNLLLSTGNNNIAIGANVSVPLPAGDDQLNIGNTLYGDLANDYIGVGVVTPLAALDVSGTVSATAFVGDGASLTNVTGLWTYDTDGGVYRTDTVAIGTGYIPLGAPELRVHNDSGAQIFISGGGEHELTFGHHANMSNGGSGMLAAADDLKLFTFSGSRDTTGVMMTLKGNTGVGIYTENPSYELEVSGTIFADVVSSTAFIGNGASLTNIVATGVDYYGIANLPVGVQNISNTELTTAELTQLQNIDTTVISATQFGFVGTMDQAVSTTSDVTFAHLTVSDVSVTGDVSITGRLDVADISATGNIQAAAFIGDGSGLTGVTGEFVVSGTAVVNTTDVANKDFIFGAPQLDDSGNVDHDKRMFFDKSKGAFRVGRALGAQWDNANIGDQSVAMGSETIASGTNSTAMGGNSNASGTNSTAIGGSYAAGNYSTAIGYHSYAAGYTANAIGIDAYALGYGSTSIGKDTLAQGYYSYALGREAAAIGDNTFAIGLGDSSGVSGTYPQVTGASSMGIFMGDRINDDIVDANTFAIMGGEVGIGLVNPNAALEVAGTVSATAFVGDGSGLTNVSGLWTDAVDYIHRDGFLVYVSGTTIDHAGSDVVAFWDKEKGAFRAGSPGDSTNWDEVNIGNYSAAFGSNVRASGSNSFAVGASDATGDYAIAMGSGANASGNNSFATGYNTGATGVHGISLGHSSVVGSYGFALGASNVTSYGTAIGNSNNVAGGSSGQYNMGIGTANIITGSRGIGFGWDNTVSDNTSTGDSDNYSIAIGVKNTLTNTSHSYAIGTGMIVTGNNSMALGVGYSASGTTLADNNTLAIMGASEGVGIGKVSPAYELDVSGTIFADVVSATTFIGDGSGLTGVTAVMGINDLTDSIHDSDDFSSLFIGNGAGAADDGTDNQNVGIGKNVLTVSSGTQNTAIGYSSLVSNTTGTGNTAHGAGSLNKNTSGTGNSALGKWTLLSNNSGNYNAAFGEGTMYFNTTGSSNSAFGTYSLRFNSTGRYNTALGFKAGLGVASSSNINNNSLFGNSAGLNLLTGGDDNVMMGHESGKLVTTGASNTIIGTMAGDNLTTGSRNILIGQTVDASAVGVNDELNIGNTIYGDLANDYIGVGVVTPLAALDVSGTVSATTFIGDGSGLTGVTAVMGINDLTDSIHDSDDFSSLFIGNGAGAVDDGTSNQNIALGAGALDNVTTGTNNIAIGKKAGNSTTGNDNIALGTNAMGKTTFGTDTVLTGSGNIAVGTRVGQNLSTGNINTAIGLEAAREIREGSYNTSLGGYSSYGLTSDSSNTVVGAFAFYKGYGESNVVIGADAARGGSGVPNYNGSVIIGTGAGYSIDNGSASYNTLLGHYTGDSLTDGAENTMLGKLAGQNLTTGSRNIIIGANVDVQNVTANDQLNIGNTLYGDLANDLVGIGTSAPAVTLDVSGTLMISNGGEVCDASTEGGIRYTSANGIEFCNASAWASLDSATVAEIAAADTSISIVDAGTGEIHIDVDSVRTITVTESVVDVSASVKVAGTGSEVCAGADDLGTMRWNPVTSKFQICRQ
ncbi:MAG: hypothetical protein ACI9TY_001228 [Alphaproteobacteria bacterium]